MSGFWLKILAMISMLIDHTGMVLFPQMQGLRVLGRLAFPLYCFLLAEGAVHTSNSKRYLGRLLGFALLSEIPFDLACHNTALWMQSQNVFFTLFLGLAACELLKRFAPERPFWSLVGVAGLAGLAEILQTDYGAFGVGLVIVFYICRTSPARGTILFTILNTGFSLLNHMTLQLAAPVVVLPILLYNGQRGKSAQQIRVLLGVSHPFVAFVFPAPVPDVVGLERAAGKFVRFLDKMESCGGRCCVLSAERI